MIIEEKMQRDAAVSVLEARTKVRDFLACADLASAQWWEKELLYRLAWQRHVNEILTRRHAKADAR
jgi:hypothetical protein